MSFLFMSSKGRNIQCITRFLKACDSHSFYQPFLSCRYTCVVKLRKVALSDFLCAHLSMSAETLEENFEVLALPVRGRAINFKTEGIAELLSDVVECSCELTLKDCYYYKHERERKIILEIIIFSFFYDGATKEKCIYKLWLPSYTRKSSLMPSPDKREPTFLQCHNKREPT